MDELVAVGSVPEPVVLLCGRPDSVPSAWWTPMLDGLDDHGAALVAEAAAMLEADGVRDPSTGALGGLLGEVAAVVADARSVLLLRTEHATGRTVQRAVVAAADRALCTRQDPADGAHDLLLASPTAAVQVLASFLVPPRPPTRRITALAGRRTPGEVAEALPEHERSTRTLLTHTDVGGEGARALTLVEHPAGTVVCWATPGGAVEVQPLDESAAVGLARWFLRADVAVAP